MLGKRAGAQAVDDRLACRVVQGGLPVERKDLLAEDRRAFGAGGAKAAIPDEGRDDVVAGLQTRDARADGFDDARRLVPVNRL